MLYQRYVHRGREVSMKRGKKNEMERSSQTKGANKSGLEGLEKLKWMILVAHQRFHWCCVRARGRHWGRVQIRQSARSAVNECVVVRQSKESSIAARRRTRELTGAEDNMAV